MAPASPAQSRSSVGGRVFTAPLAATRRIAMRTIALATVLATALLWLAVLALAASTSAVPTTSATAGTALAPTSALSLRALVAWLHGTSDNDVSPSRSSTPSIRRADDRSMPSAALSLDRNATKAEYNESTALYLAHVTSVSYCQEPHIRDWSCQPCTLVPKLAAVQVVKDAKDNFQGLVGYSPQYHAVVVAFRGSMDLTNWIDNMTFIKKRAYRAYPSVKVHQGFYWVYRSVADQLVPAIKALLTAHPSARVMVTGHSLGAAVAAICTFELTFLDGVVVDALYSFGEPRVGNADFSTMLHNATIDVFRITHFRDVVPHLPPTWIGFEHTTREVFYDQFQSSYTLCDAEHGEDLTCSDACSPFGCTSVVDHLTYLNVTMSHLIC